MLRSDQHAALGGVLSPGEAKSHIVLAGLALFFGSLLVRLINLGSPPEFDELYTVLAAQGCLVDGEPQIAEGLYDRARLYTILVAVFFDWFGESLVVARIPSVIAGSLLVVGSGASAPAREPVENCPADAAGPSQGSR
jgi:hypothetical protein